MNTEKHGQSRRSPCGQRMGIVSRTLLDRAQGGADWKSVKRTFEVQSEHATDEEYAHCVRILWDLYGHARRKRFFVAAMNARATSCELVAQGEEQRTYEGLPERVGVRLASVEGAELEAEVQVEGACGAGRLRVIEKRKIFWLRVREGRLIALLKEEVK